MTDLIDDLDTETPLTVAITGPWGSGKTSLTYLIEQRLSEMHRWPQQHLVCRVSAWLHEHESSPGHALAAAVTATVDRHRPWQQRLLQPVSGAMMSPWRRYRRELVLLVLAVLITAVVVLVPQIRTFASDLIADPKTGNRPDDKVTVALLAALFVVLVKRVLALGTSLNRFLSRPRDEAAKGTIGEVREDLGRLVRIALRNRRRLIVIVDELDRCTGERALNVCQAASKLLDHPQVITVLVGEIEPLASAAARQFPRDGHGDEELRGRRYLEKLIQLVVPLPPSRESDISNLIGTPGSLAGHRDLAELSRLRNTWGRLRARIDDINRRRLAFFAILSVPVVLAVFLTIRMVELGVGR